MKEFALKILLPFVCLLAAWWLVYAHPFQKQPEPTEAPTTEVPATEPTVPREPLPDAVLYYGEITEIHTDAEGHPTRLLMQSQQAGAWGMNLGDPTVYIDSGNFCAFAPADLAVGDRLYVFHSPMTARTLPPQSPAFALVRNIPMDAGSAMYRKVDALEAREDGLMLTTPNGSVTVTPDTALFAYDGSTPTLNEIQEGAHVMIWYSQADPSAADALMVLPQLQKGV